MKIYVDADACPVISCIEEIAYEFQIEVVLICDTNHVLYSDYSEIIIIGAGKDAVDLAIVNRCEFGDLVISQDYGVAAMALAKGAFAMNQNGLIFTNENINGLLMSRHISSEVRRKSSKNHIIGPHKRVSSDDKRFRQNMRKLMEKIK